MKSAVAPVMRGIAFAAAICMIVPGLLTDAVGLALGAVALFPQIMDLIKRKKTASV